MKKIILILILAGLMTMILSAVKRPLVTYDPNSIAESPTDPNNITVTIQMEITKEQYAAMEYLDISFIDLIHRSRLSRTLDRLIIEAKAKLTETVDVNDLKTKLESK
jgi:hypothetical protein